MEMEMDLFLAKKSAIFHASVFQLFSTSPSFYIFKAIVHLTLKSLYELLRMKTFVSGQTFKQIYLDVFYLYGTIILLPFYLYAKQSKSKLSLTDLDLDSIEHREDLHNLSALLNEVLGVAAARSTVKTVGLELPLMMTIVESDMAKLF